MKARLQGLLNIVLQNCYLMKLFDTCREDSGSHIETYLGSWSPQYSHFADPLQKWVFETLFRNLATSPSLRQFWWRAVTIVGRGSIMAINFFHLPAVLPSQEESSSSPSPDSVKATKVPIEECTLPYKEWPNPFSKRYFQRMQKFKEQDICTLQSVFQHFSPLWMSFQQNQL